jgi:hypothetical protein
LRPEDIRKIRKRIDTTLSNFRSIYGCYVNGASEIVSTMEIPVLDMENEEREMYAAILKKVLSGTQDRNQLSIVLSTDMVNDSDEHRLLMALKSAQARDENMRDLLYQRIIESVDMGGDSYVIILAADTYDLRAKDVKGEDWSEESTGQFEYFICAICPVKMSKAALQYLPGQQEFRGISTGTLLAPPALGFMFPVLDEGSADIYQAQYYTKSTSENHGELITALFRIENPPMAAEVQKETFNSTLAESLGRECSLDVVTSLQARLSAKAEAVREESPSAIAEVDIEDIEEILTDKGISDEKVKEFGASVGKRFDGAGTFNIGNLIQKRSFEVKTPETKIVTAPENALRIKTKKIDGVTYILVPAGESVTVNGVEITVNTEA